MVPDPTVLAFTVGVSLTATLLFGLLPALRSTAVDPVAGLRSGTRQTVGRAALRRMLVVAQVALSVVLVALAWLFGGSLAAIRSIDPGFHNQSVVSVRPGPSHQLERGRGCEPAGTLPGTYCRLAGNFFGEFRFPGAI